MSRPMNFKEFSEVVNHAKDNNGPFNHKDRHTPVVKYITPNMDMRTNTVGSITFRGFGSGWCFYTANEHRDLPQSLYERCMDYLKNGVTATAVQLKQD